MDTLSEVVIALLKNSVDAHSFSVAIRICPELFWLQVLDNGDGFDEADLAGVGKCCPLNIDFKQMKPVKKFARLTGSSLLEIIGRCEEVLIETLDCRHGDAKSHSRSFKHPAGHNSSQADVTTTQYQRQCVRKSQGTTVTLKNVFWQDPDRGRRHSRKTDDDYRKLLADLRAFALVHFDRSFTLQNLSTSEVEFKSKKKTTLISKYCELYQLSEQDVDITTCTKDNVCIEGYFSRREARHALEPVQLTFINGLASEAYLPTVNDVLTQQKQSLDFVLVATYPKNDVLTQLAEPVLRNCLLRCLNQYKKSLENRRKQAIVVVSPEQIPAPQAQPHPADEEDILYGLNSSQLDEDKRKAVAKCSLWLRTSDFTVRPEDLNLDQQMNSRKNGYGSKENQGKSGHDQPVDFFASPKAGQTKFPEPAASTPLRNKLPAKLPVPKFLPEPTPPAAPSKLPRRPQRITQRTPQKRWKVVEIKKKKKAQVNDSGGTAALEPAHPEEKPHAKHRVTKPTSAAQVEIPTRFDRRNNRDNAINNLLSPTREDHPKTTPNEQSPGDLSFFREFEQTIVPQKDASFLNICSDLNGVGDIHVKRNETVFEGCGSSGSPTQATAPNISNNQSAMESEIFNIFPEAHFLAPRPPDPSDRLAKSPTSRYEGLDLPECYADFHEDCHETVQHYRMAVAMTVTTEERRTAGPRSPASREIEILRQPFHEPRYLLRSNRHWGRPGAA
uniref:DNA mismatch repair protein Mlh3 n=1 Tax=Culex pipiens TaxID=7175 RepID=A0A8D8B5X0_CULPI